VEKVYAQHRSADATVTITETTGHDAVTVS
jgi:hypothetical protein